MKRRDPIYNAVNLI